MAGTTTPGAWWLRAACQSADPELFFPISAAGAGHAQAAKAKAICATCPVQQRCLEYAVESRQIHGVWGGTSEEERRPLIHARSVATQRAEVGAQRSAAAAAAVGASGRTPTRLPAV